jgi:hypothetical protein
LFVWEAGLSGSPNDSFLGGWFSLLFLGGFVVVAGGLGPFALLLLLFLVSFRVWVADESRSMLVLFGSEMERSLMDGGDGERLFRFACWICFCPGCWLTWLWLTAWSASKALPMRERTVWKIASWLMLICVALLICCDAVLSLATLDSEL